MKKLLSKIYLITLAIIFFSWITYGAFIERILIAQINFIMIVMIVIMLGVIISIKNIKEED